MLRSSKIGDLTFSKIVVAILALAVLIVLLMVFTGKMGGVSSELDSCQANGGTCKQRDECEENSSFVRQGNYSDCSSGQVCCVNVL